MAKFNSSDIIKIVRKFKIAGEENVPRQIEDLKKKQADEFSEIFSFRFLGDKFLILVDGTAEDDEFYIRELIEKHYGELDGELVKNPIDDFLSFAMPFQGKDIYLFRNKSSKNRLDVYLAGIFTEYSRSSIQKFIKNGFAKVNQKIILQPKHQIDEKIDQITLEIPQKSSNDLDFNIIFEDENVIAIEKPQGILTHSKGVLNDEFTVSDFFKNRGSTFSENTNRVGVVHRLDRETSGVIIGAKNEKTAQKLQKQFSQRTVKKTYFAIVKGTLKQKKAIIDLPIARNNSAPSTFMVDIKGKIAQTKYEVISEKNNLSLIKLQPKTGRTHQLRVHLSHIGNPILGDKVYDKSITKAEQTERMFLHASELELTIPAKNESENSQRVTFKSEIPQEFQQKMQ